MKFLSIIFDNVVNLNYMQASVICEFYSVGETVSPVIADIVFNRHVVPVEHETLSLAAISASASRANTI